jgi:NCAIR mutase (PurE)-related protein
MRRLAAWPVEDLGHTRLDSQRELRCGFPEVIYGCGKSASQIIDIGARTLEANGRLLVTRVAPSIAVDVVSELPSLCWNETAGMLHTPLPVGDGLVVVLSAGTTDGSVAAEAAITARMLGAAVEEIRDVGVAGLHRLLAHVERLREASALVVVAGMEGALPSVVGGLVERPVIAVPTSVGYGASFGGLTALLAMLNSCAAGVTVVNIDNGFGAGYAAAQINRQFRPSTNTVPSSSTQALGMQRSTHRAAEAPLNSVP